MINFSIIRSISCYSVVEALIGLYTTIMIYPIYISLILLLYFITEIIHTS